MDREREAGTKGGREGWMDRERGRDNRRKGGREGWLDRERQGQ